MNTFHFIRPAALYALPAVIILWWVWQRSRDSLKNWRKAMDSDLLRAMTLKSGHRSTNRTALVLATWILTVIAIAGPSWRPEPSPFSDADSPVMILVKADASMLTEDLRPSRMERARLKVIDFAALRSGRPTGLILYAGSAHLVLPPTRDTDVVATLAESISPDIMPAPGDNLQQAIELAERTMEGGSILILADAFPMHESKRPLYRLAVSAQKVDRASPLTVDNSDLDKIDQKTTGALTAVTAEGETRWADFGYWLTPLLALAALFPFRRTES